MKSMEKMFNTIHQIGIRNVHIWCGAGISYDSPCSLPLGNGLSEQIFQEYMLYHSQITDIWQKSNAIIGKYIDTHKIVRPEVMASCITRLNKLDTTLDFFHKFAELRTVAPNQNHYLLASFVNLGGTIYTTNFDTCIEKAYEEQFHDPLHEAVLCDGKVIKYFSVNGGMVIHLHGIFESRQKAGASIETVMKGYDLATQKMICQSLNEKLNLFLGYSFSDDYDLNNLYRRYINDNSLIYICNHEGIDQALPNKAIDLCGPGVNMINHNTTDLLKSLIPKNPRNCLSDPTDWKSILKFLPSFSREYKIVYTAELINQLQISYMAIDKNIQTALTHISEHIKAELGDYYDILQYHLFVNSSFSARKGRKQLKNPTLKEALSNRFTNNYFKLKRRARQIDSDGDLSAISKKLQSGEILTNEDHEAIASYMRVYMVSYLLGGRIDHLDLLKEVNRFTCSLDYSQGEEMYMFASSLRYRYLLHQNDSDWLEAMRIYYDIGQLGGVISSLLAKAIVESVENGKPLFKQHEWINAKALIHLNRNRRYQIKLWNLCITDIVKRIPLIGHWLCRAVLHAAEKS